MLNAILRGIRFVILVLGGYHQVALENAAFRQRLAVFVAKFLGILSTAAMGCHGSATGFS